MPFAGILLYIVQHTQYWRWMELSLTHWPLASHRCCTHPACPLWQAAEDLVIHNLISREFHRTRSWILPYICKHIHLHLLYTGGQCQQWLKVYLRSFVLWLGEEKKGKVTYYRIIHSWAQGTQKRQKVTSVDSYIVNTCSKLNFR